MYPSVPESLSWAHPLVQEWFTKKFGTPTEPQEAGWPHILEGRTTLISAPTGSGKTLAAFLICIDRLVRKALSGDLMDRTEILDRKSTRLNSSHMSISYAVFCLKK